MSNQNPVVDCNPGTCRTCLKLKPPPCVLIEADSICQSPFCPYKKIYKFKAGHCYLKSFNHCQRRFSLFDLLINSIDLKDE